MGSHVLKVQASMKYANFMFLEMPKIIHIFQTASRFWTTTIHKYFCGIDHMEGIKSTFNTSAAQAFSSVTLIIIQGTSILFCQQSGVTVLIYILQVSADAK